jgi:acetyl-CoA carboxylase biotin carboxyl carrier protein
MSKEKKTEGSGENRKAGVDHELIRDLADLLAETGLSEIEWRRGEVAVRVARNIGGQSHYLPAGPVADSKQPGPPVGHESHPGAVKSPMVGTVYLSAEPNSPPFFQVGDMVREGQTLMIVEAMKTMNPIPSTRAGRIVEVLVRNQQPVEFGQVLMLIE